MSDDDHFGNTAAILRSTKKDLLYIDNIKTDILDLAESILGTF